MCSEINSLQLPAQPSDHEYEDCISANLQCQGFYTERRLLHREPTDILDLDVVGTDYRTLPCPSIVAIETKSGDWGLSDIFKFRGQLDYLGITTGEFVVRRDARQNTALAPGIASRLDIKLECVPSIDHLKNKLADAMPDRRTTDWDIDAWRFAYWMERIFERKLTAWKNSNRDKCCYPALAEYYQRINSEVFYTPTVTERIQKLYSTYRAYPHISARTGNELAGGSFSANISAIPKGMFWETYGDCRFNVLQVSAFIEHRARLCLLKQAIDLWLGGQEESSQIEGLPETFRRGMDTLSRHKSFARYAVFWQWFMWIFGGFILLDYEEQEYRWLSEKTGIPEVEIPDALQAFDILFPVSKSWLFEPKDARIRLLQLFSVPFMGLGANLRKYLYTGTLSLAELELTGANTLGYLTKWYYLGRDSLCEDRGIQP